MFAAKRTLYLQVSPKQVTVRDVQSGETLTTTPEIALTREKKPKVLAFGSKAKSHEARGVQVVNPFGHPRSLLGDFTAGHHLIKALLARALGKRSLFRKAPAVILHLQVDPEGGFTQLEVRGFREMVLGAGAAEVVLWQGPNLSDQQLLARQFPKEGVVLA